MAYTDPMCWRRFRALGRAGPLLPPILAAVATLLACGSAGAQRVILSDDFEAAGAMVDANLWPLNISTHVESAESWFGVDNRYLRLTGGTTMALSANWAFELAGRPSTFAFDYYEPSLSSNTVTLGFSGGDADINSAEAFARIALTAGTLSVPATTGMVWIATGAATYPRDRRLTFSLALNDTLTPQPFNGGTLPARTMEVWYYDWSITQKVHALTVALTNSPRSPRRVGFRTFSTQTGVRAHFDNVKLLEGLAVVTAAGVTASPIVPPRPFVHPSVHSSPQELERMKYRVLFEPASAARLGWNRMTNTSYASLNYSHVPYANVVVMGSGTTPSETQYRNDAHAAYAAALQWVVTGSHAYRNKALTILNDWSATFVTMSPASGTAPAQIQLEAAWAAPIWVAAADIMRYHNGGTAGWSAGDIARFDGMLDYLYTEAAGAAGRENNWGASAALAMMAVGIYQENRARFDAGVRTWRNRLIGINARVDGYNDDSIYEVCRDTIHPQYTLQVWMQAAEIAWKQGIDLYGLTLDGQTPPQFARNLEYFAELFLGLRQPPCDASFTGNYLGQQRHSGAYDMAHNHYGHRLGATYLPVYTNLVVNHWRPGGFDGHFVGWSTLTHGDLSAGIPTVSALLLRNESAGTNHSVLQDGDTLNLRHYTNAVWSITAPTTGPVFCVQFFTNGIPFSLADSNAPFSTGRLPEPGNHFIHALPWRALPSGTIPGDPLVRFVRVIDLSAAWALHDIGGPVTPAWAKERGEEIILAAPGQGVTANTDQFGFMAAEISGDVQITALVTNIEPVTASAQAGIMIREGLSPGARNVFIALKPLASNGLTLQCRASPSGATTNAGTALSAGARWLRLVRFGNEFTGYHSEDGAGWTAFATATVPMNAPVWAGLAAASGRTDAVTRTVFQSALIEPLSASYAEWQHWMFARRDVTDPAATDSEANPDQDARRNEAEFWLGSDPLVYDSTPSVQAAAFTEGTIRLLFTERHNAAKLGRTFVHSADLLHWNVITPRSIEVVHDSGAVVVRAVTFPATADAGYYRSLY